MKTPANPTPPPSRPPTARQLEGRDEFNLAEFPLALLTDKAPAGVKTVEWEDEITDRGTGLAVKRKVIVTASDAYGLPTARDADVLLALIQMTKIGNDFKNREVAFSRYELLRLLDWPDEGKSYRRVEESLNRWLGTSIYFSAWRDKETETWQCEKFHVLDNVKLVTPESRKQLRDSGRGDLAFSVVSWNQVIFRNLQAGYVGPVDLDLYFTLKRAISKRIFRYLSKHFRLRQTGSLSFDLHEFAFEKVGLSRSYGDAGQIKKELRAALDELEAVGFLRPAGPEGRFTKVGRGRWQIHLARTDAPALAGDAADPAPPDEAAPAAGAPESGPEPTGLEQALADRGVTPAAAAELLRAHPAAEVARQVAAFDWLAARDDRRVSKNPAGYLVESIRRGFVPPKGFDPNPAPPPPAAAPSPAPPPAAAAAALDEDDAAARAYWDGLSPADREAHTTEALRVGDPTLAGHYLRTRRTDPAAAAGYLRALLADYLRTARPLDPSDSSPPPTPARRRPFGTRTPGLV